jgi:hypothetical protein
MEAAGSSGTFVSVYKAARRHIPEDRNLHTHLRENLRPHSLTTLHIVLPATLRSP